MTIQEFINSFKYDSIIDLLDDLKGAYDFKNWEELIDFIETTIKDEGFNEFKLVYTTLDNLYDSPIVGVSTDDCGDVHYELHLNNHKRKEHWIEKIEIKNGDCIHV